MSNKWGIYSCFAESYSDTIQCFAACAAWDFVLCFVSVCSCGTLIWYTRIYCYRSNLFLGYSTFEKVSFFKLGWFFMFLECFNPSELNNLHVLIIFIIPNFNNYNNYYWCSPATVNQEWSRLNNARLHCLQLKWVNSDHLQQMHAGSQALFIKRSASNYWTSKLFTHEMLKIKKIYSSWKLQKKSEIVSSSHIK